MAHNSLSEGSLLDTTKAALTFWQKLLDPGLKFDAPAKSDTDSPSEPALRWTADDLFDPWGSLYLMMKDLLRIIAREKLGLDPAMEGLVDIQPVTFPDNLAENSGFDGPPASWLYHAGDNIPI